MLKLQSVIWESVQWSLQFLIYTLILEEYTVTYKSLMRLPYYITLLFNKTFNKQYLHVACGHHSQSLHLECCLSPISQLFTKTSGRDALSLFFVALRPCLHTVQDWLVCHVDLSIPANPGTLGIYLTAD